VAPDAHRRAVGEAAPREVLTATPRTYQACSPIRSSGRTASRRAGSRARRSSSRYFACRSMHSKRGRPTSPPRASSWADVRRTNTIGSRRERGCHPIRRTDTRAIRLCADGDRNARHQNASRRPSQVSNDTWQLFVDLQTFNPHTKGNRRACRRRRNSVFDLLLPNRVVADASWSASRAGGAASNEDARGTK